MLTLFYGVLAALLFLVTARQVFAVPPPDFIFSVGTQVVQFFTVAFLVLSAAVGSAYQYVRMRFFQGRSMVLYWVVSAVALALVSGAGAWWYGRVAEKEAYARWLAESKRYAQETDLLAKMFTYPKRDKSSEVVTSTGGVATTTMSEPLTTTNTQLMPPAPPQKIERVLTDADVPAMITNEQLQALLDTDKTPFILDAREDLEREYGSFPGSAHIRGADLVVGHWKELPRDQQVLVLCWSGRRGKEVTDFLRAQHIAATYLERGASGWVAFGGRWNGKINFEDAFPGEGYKAQLLQSDYDAIVQSGAVVVDPRPSEWFRVWHPRGAVNIPLIELPSEDVNQSLAQVPAKKPIVTICGGYVSCFYAKIIGAMEERRGHPFLGRMVTPWQLPGYRGP